MNKRTSIWLIRHGQTTLNLQRRYQGQSDPPLTEYGVQQADTLAHRLHRIPFEVAIVSPLECHRATASAILATRASPSSLIEDPGWHDTHQGRWEGLTYQEVMKQFPQEARARFAAGANGKPTGGESLAETAQRVSIAWNNVLQRYPGGRILIVTSATPIQLVMCQAFGLTPDNHWHWRVDLGSITCLDVYRPNIAIVRMVNEVPRLMR